MEVVMSYALDRMELECNFKREVNLVNNYLNDKLKLDYSILVDLREAQPFYCPSDNTSGYISQSDFDKIENKASILNIGDTSIKCKPILTVPYDMILNGTKNTLELSKDEIIKEYRLYYINKVLKDILDKNTMSKILLEHFDILLNNELSAFYEANDGSFQKKRSAGSYYGDLDKGVNITNHFKKVFQTDENGDKLYIDSYTGQLRKARSPKGTRREYNYNKKKKKKKSSGSDFDFDDKELEMIIKMTKGN